VLAVDICLVRHMDNVLSRRLYLQQPS
jgi:hypothetical protein